MQPSAKANPPDRARWRIVGGILGLVGTAVWVVGVSHYMLPLPLRYWVIWFVGALVVALFSVLLLVAGRPWTLLGAGGLLSMGLYGTPVYFAGLMDLRGSGWTGNAVYGGDAAELAASLIALAGGVVAFVGRERRSRPPVRVVAIEYADTAEVVPAVVHIPGLKYPLNDWWGGVRTHARGAEVTLDDILRDPRYVPFDLELPRDWEYGYLTAQDGMTRFVYGEPPKDWWKEWPQERRPDADSPGGES